MDCRSVGGGGRYKRGKDSGVVGVCGSGEGDGVKVQ
jgi:hypothetical protein